MLSNWTKGTTTTTGTGTITLVAVSGFPLPSASFPVGALVAYSILTSDGNYETGFGTLGASETLARTYVTATSNGTTYNKITATALTLAAGTHNVYVDRVAELGIAASPFTFLTGPTNPNYVGAQFTNTSDANVAVGAAAQRATAWPFKNEVGRVLTGFAVQVSTGNAASQTLHAGLYEIGSDGWPGRRIARTASTIDTSTTGYKTQSVTTNVFLAPGWYWVALCLTSNTTVPSVSGANTSGASFCGMAGNVKIVNIRSDTTATDLADPFLTTSKVYTNSGGTTNAPYIGLIFA
jgi:hypothetical protein